MCVVNVCLRCVLVSFKFVTCVECTPRKVVMDTGVVWWGAPPLPSSSLLPFLELPTLSRSLPISPSLFLSLPSLPLLFSLLPPTAPPPCHTRLLRNVNSCPNYRRGTRRGMDGGGRKREQCGGRLGLERLRKEKKKSRQRHGDAQV